MLPEFAIGCYEPHPLQLQIKNLGKRWVESPIRWIPFYHIGFLTETLRLRSSNFGDTAPDRFCGRNVMVIVRGGVEDARLKANAKDRKKIRGQGQPFRGQTLLRPRTGMLEAKDQGHRGKCSQKKKKKNIFKKFFQAISKREKQKRSSQIFREVSGVFQQNFNDSKNSAVLEPRTGQFSRTWGFEAKDFKMYPRGRPRSQGRRRGLHLWWTDIDKKFLFLVHQNNV